MRQQLIFIIETYSKDELTIHDWVEIAQESETQLITRVHNILEYYFNENQII
jgi:hypothetical protein